MGLVRLAVMLLVGLSFVYLMLSLYFRSVAKENLEKNWDASPRDGQTRDEFIAAGLAEYRGSLRRRLLLGVYVVPIVLIGLVTYLTNEN
jgi:hypothetical protein